MKCFLNILCKEIIIKKILKFEERNKFVYLDYETTGEKTSRENAICILAQKILLKRQEALMTGDEELIKQINNRIKKIDIDFDNLGERKKWINLTEEEILTIAKYRIKHALSKREINRLIGIGDETLTRHERSIKSDFWSSKIKTLNAYNYDLCYISVNGRKKKNIAQ